MSRSVHKAGEPIRAPIEVFNGTTPVKGLAIGDFAVTLTKDGADASVAGVTLEEIKPADVNDPRYDVVFTPAMDGYYRLRLRHATYGPRGWVETFDVTTYGTDLEAGAFAGVVTGTDKIPTNTNGVIVASLATGAINNSAFQSGAIDAAAIAANAIGASELAADAVAEIQSGLATSAALQTVDDLVDELESRLTAGRAANLDNLDATISSRASAADLVTLAAMVGALPDAAAIAAAVAAEAGADGDSLIEMITSLYDVLVAGESEGWVGGSAVDVVFWNKAKTVQRLQVHVDPHGNKSAITVNHS